MRYLLMTCLFFLGLLGNPLLAQGAIPGPAAAGIFNDTMLVRITRRLQLTPTQQPQVAAILTSYRTDLVENPPTSVEDKRARKRAARSRVMAVLSPEQKARLKAERGARNGNNPPSPQNRHWLDTMLDDVANPLLDSRKRRRGGGE